MQQVKDLRFSRRKRQTSPNFGGFPLRPPNTAALATLNADKPEEEAITIGQSKYLNNRIEQDHRNIKRRKADDRL